MLTESENSNIKNFSGIDKDASDKTSILVATSRRRVKHQRACELCRQRKVSCDASETTDGCCSRCTTYGVECQYNPIQKMYRPSRKYIAALETRLSKMEGLVQKLARPLDPGDVDTDSEDLMETLSTPESRSFFTSGSSSASSTSSTFAPPAPHLLTDPDSVDTSDDESDNAVGDPLGYHGKSSNSSLIRAVMGLKSRYSGRVTEIPCPCAKDILEHPSGTSREHAVSPYKEFPDPDVLNKLVNAYFSNLNDCIPLLHRPTFERNVKDGLHLREECFGAVVLLVCAIGSTYVEHIQWPGFSVDPTKVPGYRYFEKVSSGQWTFLARPGLHDLQASALIAIYLNGTHTPQNGWTVLCVGIRMAQDVGAHRKKMYSATPSPEQELYKRAFWVLLFLDWMASFALGRPCAMNEEDFDVDHITECDDEYWENADPALAFRQPKGKPSKIAFFNSMVRLLKIQAFASRTLYTNNKSKLLYGFVGSEWKQNIVAELDSALNRWKDSVPSHLQWDPKREDPLFLTQSGTLYTAYYQLQICVHRLFIPSPRKGSSLSLPSLTICTNAARACVRVLDVQYQRTGTSNCAINAMQTPLLTACLVLLLNLWAGGRSERETREIQADVETCLMILKELEPTNQDARKLRALLNALISASSEGPCALSPDSESRFTARAGAHDLDSLVTAAMENIRISFASDPEAMAWVTREGFTCTVDWARTKCSNTSARKECTDDAVSPLLARMQEHRAQSQSDMLLPPGRGGVWDASSVDSEATGTDAAGSDPGYDEFFASLADMLGGAPRSISDDGASDPLLHSVPSDLIGHEYMPLSQAGTDLCVDFTPWLVDDLGQQPFEEDTLWRWPTGVAECDEWSRFMESMGAQASSRS